MLEVKSMPYSRAITREDVAGRGGSTCRGLAGLGGLRAATHRSPRIGIPDTLSAIATPRRRDGQQRRRELCDAAIYVLAEHGSHGLSHPRVDRQAGVPNGTTSYYYRTRAALLRGVAERVVEMDTANLRSVTEEP